ARTALRAASPARKACATSLPALRRSAPVAETSVCTEHNAVTLAGDTALRVPLAPVREDAQIERFERFALLGEVERRHVRRDVGAVRADALEVGERVLVLGGRARGGVDVGCRVVPLALGEPNLVLDHAPHDVVGGDAAKALAQCFDLALDFVEPSP